MSEAGVCDMETIQKTASSVINRMYSDLYPNTMYDVIFQKYQYSVTFDGSLYRYEPTEKVLQALELAMYTDNSDGALGFLNIQLAIDQGYGDNVANILRNNVILSTSCNVSFTKPK